MKPKLLLYTKLLPKRWWEYTEQEKEILATSYDGFVCIETPSIRKQMKSFNPDLKIFFPWMPQLVPKGTEYSDWNPMRHEKGWGIPQILRDKKGSVVFDEQRSYGHGWIDCSSQANVGWLLNRMKDSWYLQLEDCDGFTIELGSFIKPWPGFFPEGVQLAKPWDEFSAAWTSACSDFLPRLRALLPEPIIIVGSDGLVGDCDPSNGRLVEDFGLRGSWVNDAVGINKRSILDSHRYAKDGGLYTVVKQNTTTPLVEGYAAAALWDTWYTVMNPAEKLPLLGFKDTIPLWDLSSPMEQTRTEGSSFVRKYSAGTLVVDIQNENPTLIRFISNDPIGKGCLAFLVPSFLINMGTWEGVNMT
jgi:hypothetical protein